MTYDEMITHVINTGVYRETLEQGLVDVRSEGHHPVQTPPSKYTVEADSVGYTCSRCGGVLNEMYNSQDSIIYGGSMLYGKCHAGSV